VQGRLLDRRLAKSTIDGALSAVSALFRDAKDIELIETNPASALRVRPNDPRLNPVRGPVQRRALPPQEVRAFIAAVPGRWRAAGWMPALTSCRPAELFAANLKDVDRERQMIYLHQTVDRYGHLMNGLKGTHHVQDIDMRGRWTLFPHVLLEMFADAPTALDGTLVPSPRGKLWSIRNWYRNVWDPAVKASGVQAFTLYDLRHSFSSWLQAAGIPSLEVSGWMGHSLRAGGVDLVTTTTRIYSHATGQWRERCPHRTHRRRSRRAVQSRTKDKLELNLMSGAVVVRHPVSLQGRHGRLGQGPRPPEGLGLEAAGDGALAANDRFPPPTGGHTLPPSGRSVVRCPSVPALNCTSSRIDAAPNTSALAKLRVSPPSCDLRITFTPGRRAPRTLTGRPHRDPRVADAAARCIPLRLVKR
jgi:site-specific recombinase XerD